MPDRASRGMKAEWDIRAELLFHYTSDGMNNLGRSFCNHRR